MAIIYSDDPKAIEKLQSKIAYLEARQKFMKEINTNYRKHGMKWALENVSADTLRCFHSDMQYACNAGRIYPAYMFNNNGATLRKAKERLASLIKKQGVSL